MKKLLLLFFLSISLVAFTQQGGVNDILFTKSGEIIQGKVTKVTASSISFSYPGESLVNEISADQLQKIVFSSGRTQNFGNGAANAASTAATVPENPPNQIENVRTLPKEEIYLGPNYDDNKLSVIPLSYYKNETYNKETSSKITKFATDYLTRKNQSSPINVQDMSTTIKMLVDGGVGFQQLSETTVDKLQSVLRSEYLVMIEVNEITDKPKTAKKPGFFDSQDAVVDTESTVKYDIELIVYGGMASEKYAIKFSDERTSKKSSVTGNQEGWKTAMQYILDQVLTSGSL
ncbi:hypothetical protein LV716_16070 [Flagellimonas sp. HMM57]|uniref:hypothetical protein n=1 Tax=unclassified Flagellimonas TaxID=2644544 RepID=UPI0013D54B2E|nr:MULTISPECIES: hypothetical protein [unclassified Flagellimonas]UII75758.1 hypothetical protein LV716_16070 [Flagellimonas sp. HMM57]